MTLEIPDYGVLAKYDDLGIYSPKPAISHAIVAPYNSFKHDTSFEVNSGWINLPVAFNNSASVEQDHTVRIKLHHPQYYKIVDYAASRQSRPPLVPEMENTDRSTMDPVTTISDPYTKQQLPVLHEMSFVASCPLSTSSGEPAMFKTQMRAKYSVAKEKLYFDEADATEAGVNSFAKVQYRGKAPNDGNTQKIPVNILPQYTFSASVGPGYLEGAYVKASDGPNTAESLSTQFAYLTTLNPTRYTYDPYQGQA